MPTITFQPIGKSIEAKAGTDLLDVTRKAGLKISSSCGGEGTCGDCLVLIISGDINADRSAALPQQAIEEGYVLACKTRMGDDDVLIDLSGQLDEKAGQFIDIQKSKNCIQKELLPQKWQLEPLCFRWRIKIQEPQLEDGLSDLVRLTRRLQEDFGGKEISYSFPVLLKLADTVRIDSGNTNLMLIEEPHFIQVIDIQPGSWNHGQYGFAIDVGTTTVSVQLIYLPQAKIIATQTDYNSQVECGLDVISRINYARKPDRLKDLQGRVLKTINDLLQKVTKNHDVDPEHIYNTVISGNTTMIHLLLGLNPEYIRLSPYTPTILQAPNITAIDVGIRTNPQSWLYFSPAVGSYVGGDITAGLLCTDISTDSEDVNLFIDIGTNGETVLGSRDFLLTCACSAGPAFEGGGIECGMRAASGAIENVETCPETGMATIQTIGDVKPIGICGTGIINLIADLFLAGWLDSAGKLNRTKECPAIQIEGRRARYVIVPAKESGTGKEIYINETDIENLIRTKAAIYSACSLMLNQIDLKFEDLSNIYIAGAFGNFLDIKKAITIGLIPDLPLDKFKYIGNASLMGSYMCLVSQELRDKQKQLAQKMTYLELNTDPSYMEQYTGALFLPHTDRERFPSVKTMLEIKPEKSSANENVPPKESAHQDAIQKAINKLKHIDLAERNQKLGLPIPDKIGNMYLKVFATEMVFNTKNSLLKITNTNKPAKAIDQILFLHYLLCDISVQPNEDLISFRNIPGGQFYWNSFLSRTVQPLIKKFADDLATLKENLNRFDWQEIDMADFAARIHAFGNLFLTILYNKGDEELPTEINLLFDSTIVRVFNAEDAAVLASRICLALL
jgi:uncharacterized 2Fe-2S/4Fe-4S cluster protein (DUF4445 family)